MKWKKGQQQQDENLPPGRVEPRQPADAGKLRRTGVMQRHVGVEGAEGERDEEERRDGEQIASADFPALPPRVKQQHRRQHRDGALAQHGEDEEAEGQRVVAPAGELVVIDPENHGQQQRRQRERVLQLADPRHRLDRERVHGEKQSAPERELHPEPGQQAPDEEAAGHVQREVEEMITAGVRAPDVPLDALERERHRVVIDERARLEPDFPQARGIMHQRVGRDELAVVPQPLALQARHVGPETGEQDEDGLQEVRLKTGGGDGPGRFISGALSLSKRVTEEKSSRLSRRTAQTNIPATLSATSLPRGVRQTRPSRMQARPRSSSSLSRRSSAANWSRATPSRMRRPNMMRSLSRVASSSASNSPRTESPRTMRFT